MKILIEDVLKKQDKSIYWLAKQTDLSHTQLSNLVHGKNKAISFETIDKLCKVLNCNVGDIFSAE